jgi:hypothetical protein
MSGPDAREMQRDNENQIVNLTTEIKKITQDLDLVQDLDLSDPRAYTTFDIDLALTTVEAAIQSRLSHCIEEYKGDDKRQYASLWKSIEEEAKDAVTTLFTLRAGTDQKPPRFVNDFNRLIVTRIIKVLSLIGPQTAQPVLAMVIRSTRFALVNDVTEYSEATRENALQTIRSYSKAHAREVAVNRDKQNRLAMIREAALVIQNEAVS